jgi:hypothetical protein
MSAGDLLSVCLYALMTAALGALCLRAVSTPVAARNVASAYLAGQLGWLLLLLVSAAAPVPADRLVWGVGVASIGGWVLCRAHDRVPLDIKGILTTVGLLLALSVISFPQVLYLIGRVPLVDWDARSIWFFHGKGVWIHNGVSADFFASKHHVWSHTDYPLLIPVQAAVIGVLRGAWSEMAVKGFLGFNFLAYLWLAQVVLRARGWKGIPKWSAVVVIMTVMASRYLNGYADNHYAMPLVLAALFVFSARRPEGSGSLAALLASFALNMKNESAVYVLLGGLFCALIHHRSWRSVGRSQAAPVWLLGLVLGVAPFVAWSVLKGAYGLEGDLNLGARLHDPLGSVVLCMQRAPFVLDAMRIIYTRFDFHLMLGVVVLMTVWRVVIQRRNAGGSGSVWTSEERALLVCFLGVHCLLLLVYGLTPHDHRWHVATSIDRLLVLPMFLLTALMICAVEQFVESTAFTETDC